MDTGTAFIIWFVGLFITGMLSLKLALIWVAGWIILIIHALWTGRKKS